MSNEVTRSELADACALFRLFLAGRKQDVAEFIARHSPKEKNDLITSLLLVTMAMSERPPHLSVQQILDALPELAE